MRISTVGPKRGGPGWGYLRPDQFLDHLMVIKTVTLVRALTLGLVVPLTMFDYMSNEQL